MPTKKFDETECRLTEQEFIALLDDSKRSFVLRESLGAMESLAKDRDILTRKSFYLVGCIFATLVGTLYAYLSSPSYKLIFEILSLLLPLLAIYASASLILPKRHIPIWGDAKDCFATFKMCEVDIKTAETFKIETLGASLRHDRIAHAGRVRTFKRIFWAFAVLLLCAVGSVLN